VSAALLLAAALTARPLTAPAPLPPYGPARVLLHLTDPAITESSGLAASTRTPGVLFTHEDSGAPAVFEAVDRRGRTLTTYRVPGVTAVDWEDMARSDDPSGRSSLWFADTGDNRTRRSEVSVVRVAEPVPAGRTATTARPDVFRLAYPDGAQDAEALLVAPDGRRLWVVTKGLLGSRVYAAPSLRTGVLLRLTQVGTLDLPLVTGGAVSPDGRRVALRTYTDLYEWPVDGDDLGAALAGGYTRTTLPDSPQGESVAYRADGAAVLVGSEGRRSAVSELPVGSAAAPSGVPSPVPAAGRPEPRRHPYALPLFLAVVGGLTLLYRRRRRPLPRRRDLRGGDR
jgi:hypothetical protein